MNFFNQNIYNKVLQNSRKLADKFCNLYLIIIIQIRINLYYYLFINLKQPFSLYF